MTVIAHGFPEISPWFLVVASTLIAALIVAAVVGVGWGIVAIVERILGRMKASKSQVHHIGGYQPDQDTTPPGTPPTVDDTINPKD